MSLLFKRHYTSRYTRHACDVNYGSAFHVRHSILNSQEGAAKQKGDRSIKSFDRSFSDRSAFAPRSRVVNDAIKFAEALHGEIHERFGISGTCSVCPIERHAFAEFFFETFPFFMQQIAKNNSGSFLNETPDDACSYSSGTAGNDSNLIFQSESG